MTEPVSAWGERERENGEVLKSPVPLQGHESTHSSRISPEKQLPPSTTTPEFLTRLTKLVVTSEGATVVSGARDIYVSRNCYCFVPVTLIGVIVKNGR